MIQCRACSFTMTMMDLKEKHKKQLRKLGHALKPVVTVAGDGLKETIIDATEEALEHHELIKVKVRAETRDEMKAMVSELCEKTNAELITLTGFVALLFRRNSESPKVTFD